MDGFAKLIEAVAQVLKAVAWPGLVAFVVWHFRPSIRTFLDNISEASFKGLGVEASAKRREVAAAIVTAQLAKGEGSISDPTRRPSWARVTSSMKAANLLATRDIIRQVAGLRILWVDDHPDNNRWERKAFESMGIEVFTSTSTEDALLELDSATRCDLIISDMTRGDNKVAGFELLSEVRKRKWNKPFIFYAGSSSPEQERIAIERGATGRASDPESLIRSAVDALIGYS